MLGDAHFERGDRVAPGVADFRPRAAVERRIGQMEQDVDHPRALRPVEQPVEQPGDLGSDAGKRRGGREQRIEQSGAHRAIYTPRAGARHSRGSNDGGRPNPC